MRFFVMLVGMAILTGCSVFGESGVEIAPYDVVKTSEADNIDVRIYERMILVSTPMDADINESQRGPFMRLFDYISGENVGQAEIPMTAPVFMDDKKGQKIAMTAPVFMDEGGTDQATMSFVMPADFTLKNTPLPKDPLLTVEEIADYKVAVITFSGLMSEKNLETHRTLLESWIADNGYTIAGAYKYAGYNPPFTLPPLRRNEVLIPVE